MIPLQGRTRETGHGRGEIRRIKTATIETCCSHTRAKPSSSSAAG